MNTDRRGFSIASCLAYAVLVSGCASPAEIDAVNQRLKSERTQRVDRHFSEVTAVVTGVELAACAQKVDVARYSLAGPLTPDYDLTCMSVNSRPTGLFGNEWESQPVAIYAAAVKRTGGAPRPEPGPSKDFFWCEFMRDGDKVKIRGSGVGWSAPKHALDQCGVYGEKIPTLFESIAKNLNAEP